jgi:hypothetical protein
MGVAGVGLAITLAHVRICGRSGHGLAEAEISDIPDRTTRDGSRRQYIIGAVPVKVPNWKGSAPPTTEVASNSGLHDVLLLLRSGLEVVLLKTSGR